MNKKIKQILSTKGIGAYVQNSRTISSMSIPELREYLAIERRVNLVRRANKRLSGLKKQAHREKALEQAIPLVNQGWSLTQVAEHTGVSYHFLKSNIHGVKSKKPRKKGADFIHQRLANLKWDSSLNIEKHFFEALERDYDTN